MRASRAIERPHRFQIPVYSNHHQDKQGPKNEGALKEAERLADIDVVEKERMQSQKDRQRLQTEHDDQVQPGQRDNEVSRGRLAEVVDEDVQDEAVARCSDGDVDDAEDDGRDEVHHQFVIQLSQQRDVFHTCGCSE